MSLKVTIKDVALKAGVSTATVDRVLYNPEKVSKKNRLAVEKAIEELGYQTNAIARGLRLKKTFTIGHLLHSISPNPYSARIALAAEQEARKYGFTVLIINVQGDSAREREGVESFIRRRVDGIIFNTPLNPENVELAHKSNINIVQVERLTKTETNTIRIDNYVGSVEAMEHLISLGHKKIAYIGGEPTLKRPLENWKNFGEVERERLNGYLDTMNKYNIPIAPDLISIGSYYSIEDAGFNGDGYKFTKKYLANPNRPTAIFATCDIMAAGVLQALYEAHLRVPDDISVIGFDDTYAPYLTPPLTTVKQPMPDIGKMAVQILVDAAKHDADNIKYKEVTLKTTLLVRSSTGCAKQ